MLNALNAAIQAARALPAIYRVRKTMKANPELVAAFNPKPPTAAEIEAERIDRLRHPQNYLVVNDLMADGPVKQNAQPPVKVERRGFERN